MEASDPRHGSVAGYNAHNRTATPTCEPCHNAKNRYEKRRHLDAGQGRPRNVPLWRAKRRIHALQRLGWSLRTIDAQPELTAVGISVNSSLFRNGATLIRTAHLEAIDAVYRRLGMQIGPNKRSRSHAARAGWPAPLDWNDIDDIDENPSIRVDRHGSSHGEVDPVVVARILAGDWKARATSAERAEVVRRWNGSRHELGLLTGWKVERYVTREDVPA